MGTANSRQDHGGPLNAAVFNRVGIRSGGSRSSRSRARTPQRSGHRSPSDRLGGRGGGAGAAAAGAGAGAGAGAVLGSGAESSTSGSPPHRRRILERGEAKEDLAKYYDIPANIPRLGRGHYGVVKVGVQRGTGLKVAVKTITKGKIRNVDIIRNEVRILRKLKHPNIIQLYDVFEDDEEVHFVMELCRGGELFERIQQQQQFDEKSAAVLIKTVLLAVDHCHTHNIVHRDLKPENFLFTHKGDDAVLKIIDFGLSCGFEEGQVLASRVGTPYYIAPEVLEKNYSCECDIWSVGVILYILLCGYPPFWGDRDQDIFRKVRKGVVSFASVEWGPVSDRAKELVAGLLTSNPKERLTAKQALRHPWVVAEGGQHVKAISSSLLANMHRFALAQKLKRLALNIVVHLLEDSALTELLDVFHQITRKSLGILHLERFHAELKSCGYTTSIVESKVLLKAMDLSGNKQISQWEFCAACLPRSQYLEESMLYDAFVVLDVDGTGYIDAHNIAQAMDTDIEEAELIIEEVDTNEDGFISYVEFLRSMFSGAAT